MIWSRTLRKSVVKAIQRIDEEIDIRIDKWIADGEQKIRVEGETSNEAIKCPCACKVEG